MLLPVPVKWCWERISMLLRNIRSHDAKRGQSSRDVPCICFSRWEATDLRTGSRAETRRTAVLSLPWSWRCFTVRFDSNTAWIFNTKERGWNCHTSFVAFDLLLFCCPCRANDWLTMSYLSSRPAERSPVLYQEVPWWVCQLGAASRRASVWMWIRWLSSWGPCSALVRFYGNFEFYNLYQL